MEKKMLNNEGRYRRWVITWNNWTEHFRSNATPKTICEQINTTSGILHQYIVIGKEIAPETKKQHLQIYVEYVNQSTFTQMKQRYPGAHIEVAFSPGYQCSQYAKKENDYHEEGEYRSKKLTTEDIASNVISLLQTYRPYTIAEKFPEYSSYIVRNYKNLYDIYLAIQQDIFENKEVPF
jgi:hypothetical protein